MTLFCAGIERGEPKPVSIPLDPTMARDLAIRLWLAADESEAPNK
jgi:hypothetical protein